MLRKRLSARRPAEVVVWWRNGVDAVVEPFGFGFGAPR
jgi:hypothetical protein